MTEKNRYAVTDNGDYEWIIDTTTGIEVSPQTICEKLNASEPIDNVIPFGGVAYLHFSEEDLNKVIDDVVGRIAQASTKWPKFNSAHEGFGVLNEEFDELKEQVWLKQSLRDPEAMRSEAIDVAAMALRIALEICREPEIRK